MSKRRTDDKITPLATLLRAWAHNESGKGKHSLPTAPGCNQYLVDLLLDAADEIDTPRPEEVTKWTASSEKLPEPEGSVFAAGRDPDGNWWREVCSSTWLRDNADFATHWMPLPAFPSPQVHNQEKP